LSAHRAGKCRIGSCYSRWPCGAVGLLVFMLMCTACGRATPARSGIPINPTPNKFATQTVKAQQNSPVTVGVSVLKQRGSLAQRDIVLTIQIAVTNRTSRPIWLFGICTRPAIVVSSSSRQTPAQTRQLVGSSTCVLPSAQVYSQNIGPGIAPGATAVYRQYLSLFTYYQEWSAGSYTLTAILTDWHQGTIDQDNAPGSAFLFGSAQGATAVTLS
jgi:hypothetical protein